MSTPLETLRAINAELIAHENGELPTRECLNKIAYLTVQALARPTLPAPAAPDEERFSDPATCELCGGELRRKLGTIICDVCSSEYRRVPDKYDAPAAPEHRTIVITRDDLLSEMDSIDATIDRELAAQGLRRARRADGEPGWYVTTSAGQVWAAPAPSLTPADAAHFAAVADERNAAPIRKLGPNLKRLLAIVTAKIAIPPGGGFADGMRVLTTPGAMANATRQGLVQVDQMIAAVRSAPDNPYGDDEEIAGAILAQLGER